MSAQPHRLVLLGAVLGAAISSCSTSPPAVVPTAHLQVTAEPLNDEQPPTTATLSAIQSDHADAITESLMLLGNVDLPSDAKQWKKLIGKCVRTPTHFILGKKTSCRRPAAIRVLGLSARDDCIDRWTYAQSARPIADLDAYLCYAPTHGDPKGGTGIEWQPDTGLMAFMPAPSSLFGRWRYSPPAVDVPVPSVSVPGTVVMCADGTYSDAGRRQGACSHHGGIGG